MKSLTKGGIYYLIYNVLNMAFPFVTGIYVSRVLLPENIGTVTAAQNLSSYFVILAFLGIPTYGLREISKTRNNQKERNTVFSELFFINLISTVCFLSIYLILIFAVEAYRKEIVLYLIVGLSIALNALNIGWLYEGMEEFRFLSIRNIVFKAITFGFLVVFVRGPEDILLYALMNVIGTAGNSVVNMVYSPKFAHLTIHGLNFRRHMRSIFYLVAVNLAIELYSLVDVTMMNFWCEKENIAYYKYGGGIERILLQVVNTFTMVMVPRISFYYQEGKIKEFNQLISKTLKLIIIFALPMIIGVYFTADFLLVKLYGEPYIASAAVLKVISLLLLISPIGYLLGSRVLLATGHENKMIIAVGCGAVANIIGNAILIPRYNEMGATVASVISEIVVMTIYVSMGKKHFHLNEVFNSVWKIIIGCIVMGGFLYICGSFSINGWIRVGIQIIGGSALYVLILLLLKEKVTVSYLQVLKKKLTR